ncbi:hypothetical protein OG225_26125 [Nocardia sp. NBC_01377]|uniref:hypothetical protein n=1 Tax=Nocardia sp. NBC_01377 TaxID=2903595 RepID=UPI003244FA68
MSVVTIAGLIGFMLCVLLIRVMGARYDASANGSWLTDAGSERARMATARHAKTGE